MKKNILAFLLPFMCLTVYSQADTLNLSKPVVEINDTAILTKKIAVDNTNNKRKVIVQSPSRNSISSFVMSVFDDINALSKDVSNVFDEVVVGGSLSLRSNQQAKHTYEKDIFGNTVVKDASGRTVQTIGEDIFGNTVIKDESGRTVQSVGKDIFGNTVVKDASGRTVQTIGEDIFGNTVVKDAYGREIASFEKDIFGNHVLKSNNGNTIVNIICKNNGQILVFNEKAEVIAKYIDNTFQIIVEKVAVDLKIIELYITRHLK